MISESQLLISRVLLPSSADTSDPESENRDEPDDPSSECNSVIGSIAFITGEDGLPGAEISKRTVLDLSPPRDKSKSFR